MILHFDHGWGFDACFWEPVAALLPEWQHHLPDRGYFGAPGPCGGDDETCPNEPCLVIAHSFGAMRVLADPPRGCLAMLAINGFDRFAASGSAPGVPVRVLDRMIARLRTDPPGVVADFRKRCGDETPFGDPDVSALAADLETLRDGDCSDAAAAWNAPLVSMHAADDPLLPQPLRETAFARAPNCTHETFPHGGHLLPLTAPELCARAVRHLAGRVI